MHKICIYSALLFALTGMACQSDAPVSATPPTAASPSTPTANEAAPAPAPAPDVAASPAIATSPTGAAASRPIELSAAPSAAAPQPQVTPKTAAAPQITVAPGMNPPHGQPNHRCDIAVGAPLNSKPAPQGAANTPLRSTSVAVPTSAPGTNTAAPQITVAPGMNPPHGQPNHRCDIAVGAPLDSKPAAKQ